ncbi:MAG: carboxymuconolactone decarboxylase family protein [Candidatus Schekmanbacteria bacterium]|nr:carboxymuconolactone decarboxylase family protein [Candidatus Schekmanbacteria bacterium]
MPTPGAAGKKIDRRRIYSVRQMLADAWKLCELRPDPVTIYFRPALDPVTRELVAVAVSEVNECRYCTFVHGEWARWLGVPGEEIDALAAGARGDGHGSALAVAIAYARALADTGTLPAELAAMTRSHFTEEQRRQLEVVVRAMSIAGRAGNTADAFLSRLQGEPRGDSRCADELPIAIAVGLFGGAVYGVALIAAALRRLGGERPEAQANPAARSAGMPS